MVVLTDCKAWKSSHSDLPVSLGFGTSSGYLSPCMNLSKVESSDRSSFCSDFQVLVGFSDVFLVTLEAGYKPFLFWFLQPQVISALVHCLQKDQKLRWLSSWRKCYSRLCSEWVGRPGQCIACALPHLQDGITQLRGGTSADPHRPRHSTHYQSFKLALL